MFTAEESLNGWMIYIAGAFGAMIVWWFMTRKIPNKTLRDLLRITVFVVALVPYSVGDDSPFLAPAVMITMVEGFLTEEGSFARGGIPILIALAASYLLYFVLRLLWDRYGRNRQQAKADEAELLAEHDELLAQSEGKSVESRRPTVSS